MRRAAAIAVLAICACDAPRPKAFAGKVTAKEQLIGGPRAVGELGDYRISNERVRFIVQDIGSARAFGTFGGSLIDADLARPGETRDPRTQTDGKDGLGELFPAFFLGAVEPTAIEVLDDGSAGGTARVRVTGKQSEFITETAQLDQAALGTGLQYLVDYALGPSDDALVITAAIVNPAAQEHRFPSFLVPIPVGFICLFGAGQPLFLPGEAGFDARFALQRSYARSYQLPALPGVTTPVIAIEGDGLSYGLTFCTTCKSPVQNALPGVTGFVWNHRDVYAKYQEVQPESMLVPFVSGSLLGLFVGEAPEVLPPGAAYSVSMKLRLSYPSASAQVDAALGETADELGTVTGVVREEVTETPLANAAVVIFTEAGAAATSARTDAQGQFHARLPPGKYQAVARKSPRDHAAPLEFSVAKNGVTWLQPHLPRTALLAVEVVDQTGRRVPAKATLDASYGVEHSNQDPKEFLYDLRLGEPYRPTDLVPDTSDPETRRYMEAQARLPLGRGVLEARPGKYRLTVSRGPAYSVFKADVTLAAGQLSTAGAKVTRLLPARGRVAADLHVHAIGSVDSALSLADRAAGYAAEGVDFLALTEHNTLFDLLPTIQQLGLADFLQSTIGSEVSSLEAGHWNAYPLRYLPGPATHGAIDWFRRQPQALFDDLRAHGTGDTVVQVNHPRDSILGYFSQYGMTGDALTGAPAHDWPGLKGITAPSGPGFGQDAFSLGFDALEILTGKRLDRVRTYRVPSPPPKDPIPPPCGPADKGGCTGPGGSIVRDAAGAVSFAGALEDLEHLLDYGVRVTAVGNSDSHDVLDEPGYPRNLVDLGHDVTTASQIDEGELARAVKAGRVLVTNGPEISITVLDPVRKTQVGPGGLVNAGNATSLQVHLVIDAAPWVDVTRAALLVGQGAPCDESLGDCHAIDVPIFSAGGVHRLDEVVTISIPANKDAWVMATASGDKSMWPVVVPLEIPPLLIQDAIATLSASVGVKDAYGNLRPQQRTQALPFALTNPVLIDGDGDGRFGRPAPRPARTPLEDARAADLRASMKGF